MNKSNSTNDRLKQFFLDNYQSMTPSDWLIIYKTLGIQITHKARVEAGLQNENIGSIDGEYTSEICHDEYHYSNDNSLSKSPNSTY